MASHYDEDLGEWVESMMPMGAVPMFSDSTDDRGVQLLIVLQADKFMEAVNYPVVVEMWKHIFTHGNRRIGGRVGRRYKEEFNERERRVITQWYNRFYRWYLITGTPRKVALRLKTLELLQRAVAFFGTI